MHVGRDEAGQVAKYLVSRVLPRSSEVLLLVRFDGEHVDQATGLSALMVVSGIVGSVLLVRWGASGVLRAVRSARAPDGRRYSGMDQAAAAVIAPGWSASAAGRGLSAGAGRVWRSRAGR